MADLVSLRVGGAQYVGWKSALVTCGIEAISGAFDMTVTDRWSGQGEPWPIRIEDECTVLLNGEPMIVGYVDGSSLSVDADSRSSSIRGHDWTAALVECSALLDKWEFKNVPLLTLAKRLCEPFGLDVSLARGIEDQPVQKLSIDPGETAFEALERACRLVGVLPVSDRMGGVLLTRAGSGRAVTELVEGKNILAASSEADATGRFRSYRVLGQGGGSDTTNGKAAAAVSGSATDAEVRRSERVLLVRPDGAVTPAQAKRRAEWEAIIRAGRGHTASVTVLGWTQGNGKLWPVNAIVRVRAPSIALDSDMLITEATYSSDDSGTKTTLSLKRPDAFIPEPVVTGGPAAKQGAGKAGTSGRWSEITGGV